MEYINQVEPLFDQQLKRLELLRNEWVLALDYRIKYHSTNAAKNEAISKIVMYNNMISQLK